MSDTDKLKAKTDYDNKSKSLNKSNLRIYLVSYYLVSFLLWFNKNISIGYLLKECIDSNSADNIFIIKKR